MAGMFLLLLFFLRLPESDSKPLACSRIHPFQLPYEYYKEGDVIIGAVVTQFGYIYDGISFTEDPNSKSENQFLYGNSFLSSIMCTGQDKAKIRDITND